MGCKLSNRAGLPWLVLGGLHLWLVYAVLAFPAALSSDDALFFARGLLHFSVLEFSPHFPGYPGLMLLGRAVLGGDTLKEATAALAAVSIGAALSVPALMAWTAGRLGGSRLLAYGLAVTLPVLPYLGLSLLSDGLGLWWMVAFLGCLGPYAFGPTAGQRPVPTLTAVFSGAAWGMAVACRPSYGPFLLCAALILWAENRRAPRSVWIFCVGAMVILLPLFGGVLLLEGWSYLEEGWRFFQGHMQLWGQTALTQTAEPRPSWWDTLCEQSGLGTAHVLVWLGFIVLGTGVALRSQQPKPWGLIALFAVACGWTIAFQNPAHLRHLAPVLVLVVLLLACGLDRHRRRWIGWGLMVVQMVFLTAPRGPSLPPVMAAVQTIHSLTEAEKPPVMVVSNYGIATLRHFAPEGTIIDAYYQQDAASLQRTFPGCVVRLSTRKGVFDDPLNNRPYRLLATFSGRVWGEPAVFLYGRDSCSL